MRVVLLITLSLLGLRASVFASLATNLISTNDVLVIDRCFSNVPGGKCTLTIGPLRPSGNVYCGDYTTKVSPYFFKNENGKLAILITRDAIEKAYTGHTVEITGTATENGKRRKSRRIDATATPLDSRQGTLRFRFMADDREMVFETRYKFIAASSD
jgi:hypothetical protein